MAMLEEDDQDGLWKMFLPWLDGDSNVWDNLCRLSETSGHSLGRIIGEDRFDLPFKLIA